MAVKTLLRTRAVLDLCCGDVVLPSAPPALEETPGAQEAAAQCRRHLLVLQARFATGGIDLGVDRVLALLGGGQHAAAQGQGRASIARERARSTPPPRNSSAGLEDGVSGGSPTLRTLIETLAVSAGLMHRWAREDDGESSALRVVLHAIEDCLQTARSLPLPGSPALRGPSVGSRTPAARAAQRDDVHRQRFCEFLSRIASKGAEAVSDGGHCLLLVVVQNPSGGDFSVAVVNSGEGLQYHPARSSGAAPRPDLPVRQSPLIILGVPRDRLVCSTFWYVLYRQFAHPAASNGPGLLYGRLLPALNARPLSENFGAEPEGWVDFAPVPVAGDGSFVVCVLRAIQFCLRAVGLGAEPAAWSGVRLRRELAAASLARACAEHAERHPCAEAARGPELEGCARLVERVEAAVRRLELAEQSACSVQPPPCAADLVSGGCSESSVQFGRFERLLREDVEHLKGQAKPSRTLVSVPTTMMPRAASCCRLAANLLNLLANQQEHVPQSALARFALVSNLLARVLPMPLPEMLFETKLDLMRHLHLVARHFAAVCFTLRATRETDGARVVVSAALVVLFDALLRCPVAGPFHGELASLHYSGRADGPCPPFGIDARDFRKASETLLLVAPENQATAADFDGVEQCVASSRMLFSFDESMACSEADAGFTEQLGLCIGLDLARQDLPLLISGERPELLDTLPELGWFRDVVFLWKMLLLPAERSPVSGNLGVPATRYCGGHGIGTVSS
ncbi:unnamed protein product [Prorocentrum cordatum]|uniref:Dymeclin n=1 Tax=Prorocentrum cordatum TaxID=2364126 RepID=A0ABN9WRI9_9DINO|nr:unnamed protein product [Polarella glacialis]